MPSLPSDADWLAAAARLAARGRPLSRPNPSVGCIVVKEGKVVARGWTQAGGRPHAEAAALANVGNAAHGSTIYVSLEPCAHDSARGPSCSDLVTAARPERVVIGLRDPDPRTSGSGIARLREAGIAVTEIDCETARRSLAGYLTRAVLGRPHVTLKLAASRDGRVSRPEGEPQWITGEAARAHVHARRAQCDAILVGGETWRADHPRLDVRLPGLGHRSPQRFVLTRGEAPAGATALATPSAIANLEEFQYLYLEGGAAAADSFLSADLVDRIDLYRAPLDIGSGENTLAALGLARLAEAPGWRLIEHRQLGSDTYDAYERIRTGD